MVSPSITQVLLGKGHPLSLQRNYRGPGGLGPGKEEGPVLACLLVPPAGLTSPIVATWK